MDGDFPVRLVGTVRVMVQKKEIKGDINDSGFGFDHFDRVAVCTAGNQKK